MLACASVRKYTLSYGVVTRRSKPLLWLLVDAVEGIADSEHQAVETVLLQARDVGAALVDEASERTADLLILGLPYRKRFGGDFAIGRTIPYVFSNARCAVWVVREPISETPRG